MNKLKKLKSLLFFLILSLILVIPGYKASSAIGDTNQQVFQSVINNAYQLRSKSVLNNAESANLKNYYIQKSKIYQFEKDRYKSYKCFLNLSGEKITDMKSALEDFKVTSTTSTEANIYVYEHITYKWLDRTNTIITSELGIPHNVILVKENGNWKIAHDSYDESDITKTKSPDFNTMNVNNETILPQLQSSVISDNSNIVPDSIDPGTTYNRNAAANYAETYWSNYNTYYFNYNGGYGGDCANFASQSVHAGGGYYVGAYVNSSTNWWYNPNGSSATTKSSQSWRYCPTQSNFMLSGWATTYSSANSLSRGDLIYYDTNGDYEWDHVAIVTSFDGSGNALVSAHNTNHHNVGWTLGGAFHYKFVHFYSTI